jgi:hypothetical protein
MLLTRNDGNFDTPVFFACYSLRLFHKKSSKALVENNSDSGPNQTVGVSHLVLEFRGISGMYRHSGTIYMQLPHYATRTLFRADEFGSERTLVATFAQAK